MRVEQRLEELGLVLPGPPEVPPGFKFPFRWVRVWDGKAYVSGHSAQAPDGSFAGPFGKVPIEVSLEAAQQAVLAAACFSGALSPLRAYELCRASASWCPAACSRMKVSRMPFMPGCSLHFGSSAADFGSWIGMRPMMAKRFG